jgi:hypothetical protein
MFVFFIILDLLRSMQTYVLVYIPFFVKLKVDAHSCEPLHIDITILLYYNYVLEGGKKNEWRSIN